MKRTGEGPLSLVEQFAKYLSNIPYSKDSVLLTDRRDTVMVSDCMYRGYRFRFFIDCGELDYTAYILRGDKVYTRFSDVANNHDGIVPKGAQVIRLDRDPLSLLSREEYKALETWLIGE